MKFLIVIFAVILIAFCQINAEDQENAVSEENLMEISSLENCEERVCTRVFSPICIEVNGEKLTMTSMCHFNNIRCHLLKNMSSAESEMLEMKILNLGECRE